MVPTSSILNLVFDLTTVHLIFAFLFFSFFSLATIFHFRIKTRNSSHLKDFNSFWAVRTLLVFFVALWTITEALRLPFLLLRRLHFFPRLLTLTQQAFLCKIHVVLSLGVFEPGFLATLLFLVNVSVRKIKPSDTIATTLSVVSACCLPIFLFQILFVFFPTTRLTETLNRSFILVPDGAGSNNVVCAYPLLSSISFGAFGLVYAFSFLLSSWRVISLVINRGLRTRIYVLSSAVLLGLPIQIIFLCVSVLWSPDDPVFHGLALFIFFSVLCCAVVGVGILVIKPIRDALALSGEACPWNKRDVNDDRLTLSADVETGGIGLTGEGEKWKEKGGGGGDFD
ncbi:uncharacterized protein LOC122082293 [Macadamia integrifolia]|uniref:uncharacterized protein LOC122082293 n=1 Tax=Macadamia integrifolia TaxID=60698 RepID=UPI001C4E8066|nr:uncharacterized protein LOC122082293 [Macadamia integrifolia]